MFHSYLQFSKQLFLRILNKQTNKQTSKQANKQTSKQANKQTNKQTKPGRETLLREENKNPSDHSRGNRNSYTTPTRIWFPSDLQTPKISRNEVPNVSSRITMGSHWTPPSSLALTRRTGAVFLVFFGAHRVFFWRCLRGIVDLAVLRAMGSASEHRGKMNGWLQNQSGTLSLLASVSSLRDKNQRLFFTAQMATISTLQIIMGISRTLPMPQEIDALIEAG